MSRSIAFPSLVASLCLSLGACGDIEVRSIRSGDVVPAQLEGEWHGAWQSELSGISGVLTLRIQDFGGEPVVAVEIAHPCVPPARYEFRATANTIQLLDDGEVLFDGLLGDDRTLVGSYACLADSGSWDASWQRALPELVDLGGTWSGTITAPGFDPQALELQLVQTVRDGTLLLQGTLGLPGLPTDPLPIFGQVQFGDAAFELLLVTEPGTGPLVHMTGLGDPATRTIGSGDLQAAIDPLLPILQAEWDAQWIGP